MFTKKKIIKKCDITNMNSLKGEHAIQKGKLDKEKNFLTNIYLNPNEYTRVKNTILLIYGNKNN